MTSAPEIRSHETMSAAMADALAYHEWVYGSFARHLAPGATLEVGSGHAFYARRLARQASRLIVSDIDPAAVERIRGALADLPNVEYRVMDGIDVQAVGRASLDNVVLVNVLEHIFDDEAVLRAAADVLRPGGRLILFVPAHPMLYGRMDAEGGHHRRYRKASLLAALERSGLSLIEARYFNAVGFFGWLANRFLSSGLHDGRTNAQIRIFDRLVPVFREVDRFAPFLGQSLVAVATVGAS